MGGREHFIESLMTFATAELGKLGEDLNVAQMAVQDDVVKAESLISASQTAMATAEERSASAGESLEVAVAEWYENVGQRCGGLAAHCDASLDAAQRKASQAAKCLSTFGGQIPCVPLSLPIVGREDATMSSRDVSDATPGSQTQRSKENVPGVSPRLERKGSQGRIDAKLSPRKLLERQNSNRSLTGGVTPRTAMARAALK